ncbi:MAG TPA: hypothetical protein VFE72_02890 [Lysobacter sp.]|nr:hypothetical protein [Lysobacter sp.]
MAEPYTIVGPGAARATAATPAGAVERASRLLYISPLDQTRMRRMLAQGKSTTAMHGMDSVEIIPPPVGVKPADPVSTLDACYGVITGVTREDPGFADRVLDARVAADRAIEALVTVYEWMELEANNVSTAAPQALRADVLAALIQARRLP